MADKRAREPEIEFHCEEIDHTEIEIVQVWRQVDLKNIFDFNFYFQLIGKGSFGSVYKANWRDGVVAVKALSALPDKGPLVEVRYLSRVQHPNIIRLYATCVKGPNVCLIMEYGEGGSLYNLLHCSRIKYTASNAMSWCRQCADVSCYKDRWDFNLIFNLRAYNTFTRCRRNP